MEISPDTAAALAALNSFSGGKLVRAPDLGVLMELAVRSDRRASFDELSFLAKFLHRALGIMKRIGKSAEGYDKLSAEFNASLEKATEIVRELVAGAPSAEAARFQGEYLAMTPVSFDALLELLYDLSWHKNWLIDHDGDKA